MFDILMYLFENYVHSEVEMLVDEDELTQELTRAGFHQSAIIKALSWLERLASLQESDQPYLCNHDQHSFRIYTENEMESVILAREACSLARNRYQTLPSQRANFFCHTYLHT